MGLEIRNNPGIVAIATAMSEYEAGIHITAAGRIHLLTIHHHALMAIAIYLPGQASAGHIGRANRLQRQQDQKLEDEDRFYHYPYTDNVTARKFRRHNNIIVENLKITVITAH